MSLRQVQPLEVKRSLGFTTAQSNGGYDIIVSQTIQPRQRVENAGQNLTAYNISDLIPWINLNGGIGSLNVAYLVGTIQPEASTGVLWWFLYWGQDLVTDPPNATTILNEIDYANIQNIMNLTGVYQTQTSGLFQVPPALDPANGLYIALQWENVNAPDDVSIPLVAYTPVVVVPSVPFPLADKNPLQPAPPPQYHQM
jgi:hypothetical protein